MDAISYATASILTGLRDTLEFDMASTTLPILLLEPHWVQG